MTQDPANSFFTNAISNFTLICLEGNLGLKRLFPDQYGTFNTSKK